MELGSGCAMKNSGCYFIAASTARLAMTVIRCARYSGLACRSLLRPSAFTLILATDSGANFEASAFSMSAWRNAQGPAPVTPTRTLPPKSATNTPTMAKRDAGFFNFHVGGALRYGKRARGDQPPRLERGFVQAFEDPVALDLAFAGDDGGAQGEHGRRVVGRGVFVGERAADRPQVPDLPVADDAGERGERGDRLPHGARGGHLGVPHHRADRHGIALRLQRLQVADRVEIDQVGRRRQAQLHRLHQALAAGEVSAFLLL